MYGRAFLQKKLTASFAKKAPPWTLDRVLKMALGNTVKESSHLKDISLVLGNLSCLYSYHKYFILS